MLLLTLLLAADLCAGRVTDKINHPMPPNALDPVTLQPIQGKPAVGVPFLDPSFGTIITRIAAPNPAEGENAIIKPMYSTVQPWNADESRIILWHRNRGHELYLGDIPYTFIRNLNISPTDIEHVAWDPVEPRTFYYPTGKNQGRKQLIQVRLGVNDAPTETVMYDFTSAVTACPINATDNRYGFGADPEIDIRGPRKLIGLMCGTQGRTKIVFSITENRVVSWVTLDHTKPYYVGPVASIVAPSEERMYLGGGYVLPIDFSAVARRLTAAFYYEHSQVAENESEGDTWNAIAFNESSPGANDLGTLVSHSLLTGERKVIIGPATGWPYPASGTHISTTGPKGWVFVGSVGSSHNGQFVGDNELLLANTDTGQVCRVGHNRTWAGTNCGPLGNQCPGGYFSETHGSASRKGDRLIFGSDGLGFTGLPWTSTDTYVVDLRRKPLRVKFSNTCDVQSLSPTQTSGCTGAAYEVVP